MRNFLLVMVILMSMVGSNAQTVGTCPIPTPSMDWIDESASSLGLTSFSGSVQVIGSFIVDVSTFTFDGADVGVFSGGEIFVNPGCTLRVLNGSIVTNSQNIWEGITVLEGGRLEVEESDICGAIIAIEVFSSGLTSSVPEFHIVNSGLRRNQTCIYVLSGFPGTAFTYPGYVVGTHFEGGVLPIGSTSANSYVGVITSFINGGTGLTIGDDNTLAGANRFTEMDYGILGISSSLQVFNNEFEDIQEITGGAFSGGAVVAVNELYPESYGLRVGTSITKANTMVDCRYGVYSQGMKDVLISNNMMNRTTEPFEIGIWINKTDETIGVRENTIKNFSDAGVLLDENPGFAFVPVGPVDALVENNILEGSYSESRGILADDLVGEITIRLNQIDKVHRGIIAQSMLSASKVLIDSNKVLFGYPGAPVIEPAVGILAIQVEKPTIFQNEIEGNCPFSSGGGPCTTSTSNNRLIRGIQLVKTHKARVYTNKTSYCGAGLFVLQDNLEGNAVCNEFFDNYSGVVWASLGTGEFGETVGGTERVYGLIGITASSDNRWTTSVPSYEPFRSISINSSDAGSVDWYFRNAATFDFPAGTNINLGLTPLTALAGMNTTVCDTLALFRGGENPGGEQESFGFSHFRESEMDGQIASSNPTTISDGLYAFLAAAHRSGVVHDKVQTLLNQTSIDDFAQINALWREADLFNASSVLNGIAPINTEESLLRDVWAIRLNHAANSPIADWSDAEALKLREIASRDLEEAGSAAILAQSLLGLTLLPNDWILDETEERLAGTLPTMDRIYPNPAQTVVYLDANTEAASVMFTNLQGQIKLSVRLEAESSKIVDISNLPKGLYIVQILKDSGSSDSYKLFITR